MKLHAQQIKCLYYPYSRSLRLNTLKKAILLFDEINFLDSQPWFIRRELLKDSAEGDITIYDTDYEYLGKEGVIKIIDPEKIIHEFDTFITANIVNDIRDDDFCEIAVNHDVTVWDVLRERIPPSFLEAFYPGAGTFSEAISLQALIKAKGSIDQVPEHIRNFAEFRWHSRNPEELWRTFIGRYKFVIGGNPHMLLESYEVPFLQASSLRINEALIVSAMNGCIPFTDSAVHDQLMRFKVNRSLRSLTNDPSLREKLETELPASLPQEHLALAILDHLIPEAELDKRSVKELLEYRRSNEAQLVRFREKLAELATEINDVEPDAQYYKKIRNLITSKAIPEISKARDELLSKYEEAFGKLVIRSAQVVVPTIAVTVFGGLGIWEILGACALAEVGMLTTKGSDDLLSAWRARRALKRNAFSYLTGL